MTGLGQQPTTQPKGAVHSVAPADELTHCLRLIRDKQYAAARSRLEAITAAHPEVSRAWLLLALTYHEEQRYGMARPLFEKTLRVNPDEHSTRPFFGWCLYYLGRGDAAIEQFELYLKINPNYADAHFAIGLVDYDRDELEKAVLRFTRTIEIARATQDPRTEGKARARIADVCIRRGELAKARDELLAAVKLRPDAYEAYFKLSRVYHRLGESERAAWARKMHDDIREQLHPSAAPSSQPAAKD